MKLFQQFGIQLSPWRWEQLYIWNTVVASTYITIKSQKLVIHNTKFIFSTFIDAAFISIPFIFITIIVSCNVKPHVSWSSFGFVHHIVVKMFDILEECSSCTFRVDWGGTGEKFCQLHRTVSGSWSYEGQESGMQLSWSSGSYQFKNSSFPCFTDGRHEIQVDIDCCLPCSQVDGYLTYITSYPNIVPLSVHCSLWQYMEGDHKWRFCIMGNLFMDFHGLYFWTGTLSGFVLHSITSPKTVILMITGVKILTLKTKQRMSCPNIWWFIYL